VLAGVGSGVAAALAGCTGGGTDSSNGGASTTGSVDSSTVEFWFTNFDNASLEEQNQWYFDRMQQQHGIDIKPDSFSYADSRKKFLTGAKTGTPDLLNGSLSHTGEYAKADLIEPLTDRVKQLDYYDEFADGALEACSYQGEIYGLPMIGGGRVLLYRTDVFESYGFEPPETMEELVEIGSEITKNEDGMTGFLNTTKKGEVRAFQEFMTHVFQMGEGLFSLDGDSWNVVLNGDELGEILDWFYARQYLGDGATPADPDARGSGWEAVDIGYLRGNHAMAEGGNWVWGFTERAPDADKAKEVLENTGAARIPAPPSASDPRSTWLGATPTMMSAYATDKEATWTALREHASPEMIRRYGEDSSKFISPPMIQSVDSAVTREDRSFLNESVKTGKSISFVSWGKPREAILSAIQQVVYDETDPYDAGTELRKRLSEMTQEFKM
jgi:ABC-type glycerol-3-phosphate transport system substrate-binding protein